MGREGRLAVAGVVRPRSWSSAVRDLRVYLPVA